MPTYNYFVIFLVLLAMILLGFLIGYFSVKKPKYGGKIVIETTEDGERERIRFLLDDDLDSIKYKTQLVLKVDNRLMKARKNDNS